MIDIYSTLTLPHLIDMILDWPIGTIASTLMYMGLVYAAGKMVRVVGWVEI